MTTSRGCAGCRTLSMQHWKTLKSQRQLEREQVGVTYMMAPEYQSEL
jgi:hypothetical protein